MIEYLSDLRLFCEISQTLNFRQAGEKLGYSAAVVSMRVKRLETVTGKTLFLRTTRHVVLTEEGRELLNLAQQTLDLAESMSAPRYADLQPEEVRGTVRITAPYSFARVFLSRPLRNIQESFPNLTLELILEDTLTHLVREGIDISFRVGGALDSGVASKELLQDRRILVASPDYLQRFGTPQNPDDLKTHRCLGYVGTKHWHLV
ncbi:MAG: LysR family transcriptional regulator, partial [Oceanobacter sp.]